MGVSTTTNRVTYNGNGSTTSFSFPYYFFKQADLAVYLFDTVAGGITSQVLGTNYTITGTQNAQGLYQSGGNVVFGTAPPSTSNVVITRSPSFVQNYSLLQNGNINSAALVQQFDYLTLMCQRLQDQINSCVALQDGNGQTFSPLLPSTIPLASSELAFPQVNSTANGLILSSNSPGFSPYVTGFAAAQTASNTIQIPLFTLPASTVLNSLFIKSTQSFQGSGITDVVSSIGISGNYTKFINNYDLYASVGDQNFESILTNYLASWANPTTIYLQIVSSGAQLTALSQGSVTVNANVALVGAGA